MGANKRRFSINNLLEVLFRKAEYYPLRVRDEKKSTGKKIWPSAKPAARAHEGLIASPDFTRAY